MQKFLLLLGMVLIVGAGCGDMQSPASHGTDHTVTPVINVHGELFAPGEATLTFALTGEFGEVLTDADLEVTHEKLLHVMVVKSDMSDYQHVHPDYVEGAWRAAVRFPEAGTYYVYADAKPRGSAAVLATTEITVEGAGEVHAFPKPQHESVVEGVMASLPPHATYLTGQETALPFRLTDAVSGAVAEDIEPYLGAYGHVVALRHGDPRTYIHAHPVTGEATDGTVEFMTSFQKPGMYTLFAQFQVRGMVRTFPLIIEVAEGSVRGSDTGEYHLHH